MNITEAIEVLDAHISNQSVGLPEDIFQFFSRNTPMVNVDLLIKDENNRTLLSWRDTQSSGVGWHVPGGIIRYKERLEYRIQKVAEIEIGPAIKYDPVPIAINQVILEQKIRGHFLSLLYKCSLSSNFIPPNKGLSGKEPGFLQWHNSCPDNLIKVHEMYRKYI